MSFTCIDLCVFVLEQKHGSTLQYKIKFHDHVLYLRNCTILRSVSIQDISFGMSSFYVGPRHGSIIHAVKQFDHNILFNSKLSTINTKLHAPVPFLPTLPTPSSHKTTDRYQVAESQNRTSINLNWNNLNSFKFLLSQFFQNK